LRENLRKFRKFTVLFFLRERENPGEFKDEFIFYFLSILFDRFEKNAKKRQKKGYFFLFSKALIILK